MQMIQSGGLWLHIRQDGAPDAPPLLLVNSLGTDLRMWDNLIPDLTRDFRVIRFDKPGHGLSQTACGAMTIAALAGHALAALDAFDAARADVLGLSIGGQIALSLALDAPHRLRHLVLSNTAAKIGTSQSWGERIAALQRGGIAPMAGAVLERWFSEGWRAQNPSTLAGYRAMLERCDLDGYLGCCAALAAADFTARCGELRGRVHLIAGGCDGATPPAVVRATADLIAGARLHLIDAAGHLPSVEAPQTYVEILRQALLA